MDSKTSVASTRKRVALYDTGIGRGGSKHSLLAWIDLLAKSERFEVIVLASGPSWLTGQLDERKIPWRRLPIPPALAEVRHGSWRNPFLTLWRILRMTVGLPVAWVRSLSVSADAVVLTGGRDFIVLLPLVWRLRKRAVTIPQTTDWARIPSCKTMCRTVAEVWAISETVAASIREMGIVSARIRVMPLIFSSESAVVTKAEARERWRIPEDAHVIGLVGVLRPQKGQLEAVEIFARVADRDPKAMLVVAGAGSGGSDDYVSRIALRISELGLEHRVLRLGWCDHVAALVRAFDMLWVPSLDNEGVPRVILEGLEAKLPVVANDIPQFREILGSTGVLISLSDAQKWADATMALLNGPEECSRQGTASFELWETCYSETAAGPQILGAMEALTTRL